MGVLYVKVGDELETRFRIAVIKLKGKRKGSLSEAIEEAISLWLSKNEKVD